MTVQELIDRLQMITDKNIPVGILREKVACGSAQTGMYGAGEECLDIDDVKEVAADTLAALTSIDEVDHVELISEELIDVL